MIFQLPIAWLGLIALAIPVAVHWLGRRPARRQKFPTLQFLGLPRQLPVRRAHLSDRALLALRVGIVATAVAALAQPLWLTGARSQSFERLLARAILVDTSASMRGRAVNGDVAIDRAHRDAAALGQDATASRTIESRLPSDALPGAVAWLQTQTGRRELVVISDFQPNALAAGDLEQIPSGFGVRLVRIDASNPAAPTTTVDSVVMLAAPTEDAAVEAARRAVTVVGGRFNLDADHLVALVFPQSPERGALRARATAVNQAWMFDVVAGITREWNQLIGHPAVIDARAADGRLVIFTASPPASFESVALALATSRAISVAAAPELDTRVRSDQELRSWERPPAAVTPSGRSPQGHSDGRWVWALVLLWLALETWARRRATRGAEMPAAVEGARVA